MDAGEWVILVVQTVAVSIAAFAAWQARRSADASRAAVEETRSAREAESRTRELQRLESIRRTVIVLKSMTDQHMEGTPGFRFLQGELKGALPPPVGKQGLLVCAHLAEARKNEAKLAEQALSEIDNVIGAFKAEEKP